MPGPGPGNPENVSGPGNRESLGFSNKTTKLYCQESCKIPIDENAPHPQTYNTLLSSLPPFPIPFHSKTHLLSIFY